MIERFMARVGKVGAIVILFAAIVVIGFGGGVVEHYRLAAQTEQQGEQDGSRTSSTDQKQPGAKDQAGSDEEGDEAGEGQQS